MERYWMAAAVVREGDRLLLVQNRWRVGTHWFLPGGRLEPGESAVDAVVREVAEETGLEIAVEDLAYVQDNFNREMESQFLYLVFAGQVVGGTLRVPEDDPYVVDVRWVPVPEVGRYVTWPAYRDPLLEYLAGRHRRYYVNRDAGLK
ncbi:MAG: NUDIX hydrolase [Firmicutes bacterium]|nr:NUDIX hydrolase [Bacillota bacterium]